MPNQIDDFGKGAVPIEMPPQVLSYSDIKFGTPVVPFDWITGFDLSRTIPLKVENQNGSSSCVGQAWAKYAEILEYVESGVFTDLSARFIYSRIWIAPDGGAYVFKGGDVLVDAGTSREATTPSYKNLLPPDELFMRVKDVSPAAIEEAKRYRAQSHAYVVGDINTFARAIRDQNGLVFGFIGTNEGVAELGNGIIRIPKVGETVWGHAVCAVGAVMVAGRKYIKFINSWGSNWGDHGYGYVGEDYFNSGYTFNGLTLVDLPNQPMTFEAVQVVGAQDVWLVRDGKRTLVHDASAFSIIGDWSKIRKVSQAELDAIPKSGFELATLTDN